MKRIDYLDLEFNQISDVSTSFIAQMNGITKYVPKAIKSAILALLILLKCRELLILGLNNNRISATGAFLIDQMKRFTVILNDRERFYRDPFF